MKQKLKVQNLHLDQPQQVQLEHQHHQQTKFQPQQPQKVQKKKKMIHNLHKMWLNLLQDITKFRFRGFRFRYLL